MAFQLHRAKSRRNVSRWATLGVIVFVLLVVLHPSVQLLLGSAVERGVVSSSHHSRVEASSDDVRSSEVPDALLFRNGPVQPIAERLLPLDEKRAEVKAHFMEFRTAPGRAASKLVVKDPRSPLGEQDSAEVGSGNDGDFCFISHGCWGGLAPQKLPQRKVAKLITRLIRASYGASPDEIKKAPFSRSSKSGGAAAPLPSLAPIRFVVAAGDNIYRKGVSSVTDELFFTTFEFLYGWDDPLVRRVPWILAPGNHDYQGNFTAQVNYTYYPLRHAEAYNALWKNAVKRMALEQAQFEAMHRDIFGTPETSERLVQPGSMDVVTGRWFMPETYFVTRITNDMVLFVIDTPLLERCHNLGAAHPHCWDHGRQRRIVKRWLLHDYADTTVKVVVGHYPLFSNGPHANFPWLVEWLEPLLERACVSMYIHADNHYLQVSKRNSTFSVNSGGGAGISLHHFIEGKSWKHPSSIFQKIEFGVMVHCREKEELKNYVFDEQGEEVFRFRSWPSSRGGKGSAWGPSVSTGADQASAERTSGTVRTEAQKWDSAIAPNQSVHECLFHLHQWRQSQPRDFWEHPDEAEHRAYPAVPSHGADRRASAQLPEESIDPHLAWAWTTLGMYAVILVAISLRRRRRALPWRFPRRSVSP